MLLLFDIDGTLLTGATGRTARRWTPRSGRCTASTQPGGAA